MDGNSAKSKGEGDEDLHACINRLTDMLVSIASGFIWERLGIGTKLAFGPQNFGCAFCVCFEKHNVGKTTKLAGYEV